MPNLSSLLIIGFWFITAIGGVSLLLALFVDPKGDEDELL